MRVASRIAEHLVEAVKQALRDGMLEDLRFFVHLIPRKAEGLVQVGFEQAVASHHAQGDGTPLLRQTHTPIALVCHESLPGEALDILRRRRRDHAHVFADVFRLNAITASFLGAPHELEDVLDDC